MDKNALNTTYIVIARDEATQTIYRFDGAYRFGRNPSYFHGSHNLAETNAFDDVKILQEASIGEEIYIEWQNDNFLKLSTGIEPYIKGSTVWRRSFVLDIKNAKYV